MIVQSFLFLRAFTHDDIWYRRDKHVQRPQQKYRRIREYVHIKKNGRRIYKFKRVFAPTYHSVFKYYTNTFIFFAFTVNAYIHLLNDINNPFATFLVFACKKSSEMIINNDCIIAAKYNRPTSENYFSCFRLQEK